MFGGQQHKCWASPRSIINQKLCSKCMTLVLVDCTLVFFLRRASRQSKSGMPPSILSALCLMLLWVTDLQTEGFKLAQWWWLERLLAEVSAWAGPPLSVASSCIKIHHITPNYWEDKRKSQSSNKQWFWNDCCQRWAPTWPQTHVTTRHIHTAAAAAFCFDGR